MNIYFTQTSSLKTAKAHKNETKLTFLIFSGLRGPEVGPGAGGGLSLGCDRTTVTGLFIQLVGSQNLSN